MKNNDNIKIFANKSENPDDFYIRFKEQLDTEHHFPGNYMFKFIILTESKKIAQLHKIFDHSGASFSIKESKNRKYTSITVNIYAVDAHSVVEYYKEASTLEGIVML
ncbi:DUF493 family protein [Apibacter sp.]|uniref:DUF493 family protein n=1 Tax=Apibacter sp. TaxID=2023709 RepID=UPI0025D45760|nr:DUF493 family protein [Apibacter sp.]MCT6869630.1 DUF493 domain-containing protein [Apibacter sp.]